MPRASDLYLDDILESIRRIEEYTAGMDFAGFEKSHLVQDGVLRNLAVIGEAVKKLPGEMRESTPHVEWRKIAGLRDVVIHEYASIDLGIVWNLVESKISDLKTQVRALRAEDPGTE